MQRAPPGTDWFAPAAEGEDDGLEIVEGDGPGTAEGTEDGATPGMPCGVGEADDEIANGWFHGCHNKTKTATTATASTANAILAQSSPIIQQVISFSQKCLSIRIGTWG